MKKVHLKIKGGDLKITDEQKRKYSAVLLKNRRLFFIIFLGAVSVYSFNIIFKKAYVEINYVQFPVESGAIGESKSKTTLGKIIKNIEDNQGDLAAIESKQYTDPFSFRDNVRVEQEDKAAAEPVKEESEADDESAVSPDTP